MKNLDALVEQMLVKQAKEQEVKRAERAVNAAYQSLRAAEDALADVFWKKGGVTIRVEVNHRLSKGGRLKVGSSKVRIVLVRRLKKNAFPELGDIGRFENVDLATFSSGSKIGKAVTKFVFKSLKQFRYVVSLGVLPDDLELIAFGDHYFEKNGKRWVEIK